MGTEPVVCLCEVNLVLPNLLVLAVFYVWNIGNVLILGQHLWLHSQVSAPAGQAKTAVTTAAGAGGRWLPVWFRAAGTAPHMPTPCIEGGPAAHAPATTKPSVGPTTLHLQGLSVLPLRCQHGPVSVEP
jgi:hypothetical protein